MGQEKDANLTIDIKTPGAAQHQGNPMGNNLFSKHGIYITQGDNRASTPLDFTATFTNLKDTYYGPKDDRQAISKIVEEYHVTQSQSNNIGDGMSYIVEVNQQPQEGWWYTRNVGVQITFKFYDQNGNQIKFGKNAYLAVSSLNSTPYIQNLNNGTITQNPFDYNNHKIEVVGANNNLTLKTLVGSSVIVNSDGQAYSPAGNDDVAVGFGANIGHYVVQLNQHQQNGRDVWDVYEITPHGSGTDLRWQIGKQLGVNWSSDEIWAAGYGWWDGANGANGDTQYFGATVGLINEGADSFTLTTYTWTNVYPTMWAMVSTDIPSTPSYELHVPVQEIHYHYINSI